MTHIYVSRLNIIGLDPTSRQAIIWNITSSNLRINFQRNLKRNPYVFIQENAFEHIAREMAAILPRPQIVNFRRIRAWNNYDIYLRNEMFLVSIDLFFVLDTNRQQTYEATLCVRERGIYFCCVTYEVNLYTFMSDVMSIMAGIFWNILCQIALESTHFPEHG